MNSMGSNRATLGATTVEGNAIGPISAAGEATEAITAAVPGTKADVADVFITGGAAVGSTAGAA